MLQRCLKRVGVGRQVLVDDGQRLILRLPVADIEEPGLWHGTVVIYILEKEEEHPRASGIW